MINTLNTAPASTIRPGYRTTEFWTHVALQAGVVLAALAGGLPAQYAAIAAAASQVAYALSRGLSKAGAAN